ncbi:benzoyl-CoA reductase, bzd-type, subunit Q [Adlercreutzia sp. ZJ138]|uniref:benzoyl-CoA reductase, bzd-type, subunit Q n=1 Tax=Adlercreutzia sp. ZJ138 TaxID=2709405 RepID=UPI0013EA8EC5|nr:benzoyl-CoA reductase, bzd-type, subunit Q [Adlercreutzia sp. ZJ138]
MLTVDKKEYWRWEESRWLSADMDNPRDGLITAGVDVGSTSTQAVVTVDGEIYCYANVRTGNNSPDSARNAMDYALGQTDLTLDDIRFCVGTGYGRVNVPFADKAVTEITCHAKGANYMYGPTARTLLDMGGQDCKAILCNETGKVLSFAMNEKCAAGTGRGMEVIADLLGVHVEDIGDMSLSVSEEPQGLNNTCVVYAKSEAIAKMRLGWTREMVLAAYCQAMAERVVRLINRNGVIPDFAITGGIAKNKGVVRRIERLLGVEALKTNWDTQIAGALGAALVAKRTYERKGKK